MFYFSKTFMKWFKFDCGVNFRDIETQMLGAEEFKDRLLALNFF